MKFGLTGTLWARADELDTDDLRTVPTADSLTTGAAPVALTLDEYRTNLVTDGETGAGQVVDIPSGEYVGQRKLAWLLTRTGGSDTATFTMTNIEENLLVGGGAGGAASALVLDAAGEYALFEWTGAKWNILYTNGTLTT